MEYYKKIQKYSLVGMAVYLLAVSSQVLASENMKEAEAAMKQGNYNTAMIHLKNQLKQNPNDAQARLLLGKAYLDTGNFASADKEFRNAYKLDKSNPEIILGYAQILLAKQEYDKVKSMLAVKFKNSKQESQRLVINGYVLQGEKNIADAIEQFNQSIQLNKKNNKAYAGLIKIALLEKDNKQAEKLIKIALNNNPDDQDVLLLKAQLANVNGQPEEALQIYTALLEKNKHNLYLRLGRAATKMLLKDYKGAEADLEPVLKKSEHHPQANYLLAQIKLSESDYVAANNAAQKVLNVSNRHYPSILITSISNLAMGNYNQAEKYLTHYLSAFPDNTFAQNLLAQVYLIQNNFEQTILILESLDSKQLESNAGVMLNLGTAYLMVGEHDKGIELLIKANALSPDKKVIQKRLVSGYLKTGDMDNIITALEKLTQHAETGNKNMNYFLVITYMQGQQYLKAKEKLKGLIKQTPDDPALYVLDAVVALLDDDLIKAKKSYQKAIIVDWNYIPAYMGLAPLALKNKNYEEAKSYYNRVLSINDKYIKAYVALALVEEKTGNLKKVEPLLKVGYEKSRDDFKAQFFMAGVLSKWYLKQKQSDKAIKLAAELVKQYPDKTIAYSFQAQVLIESGETERAEKVLKQITYKDTKDTINRLLLADLISRQPGREKEVLELLDEVTEIEPEQLRSLFLKTAYLIKLKRYPQALESARQVQQQFPQSTIGKQLEGDVYLSEGKLDKALVNYQQAYQIQPANKLLAAIVALMKKQGQEQQSIILLQKELEKNTRNAEAHFILAQIFQQQKAYDKAVKHYQAVLKEKQDNIITLNNLAWVYAQEKNPKALDLARKAYKKSPKSATVLDTYGYIHLKQGDIIEGVKLLEQAVNLAPESYNIKYHLAEGYHLNGDNKKAKAILSSILNENITFFEKENAQALFKKL